MPILLIQHTTQDMYRLLLLTVVILSSCSNERSNPDIIRWEEQASNVSIIRDGFGVPHVYGKTDADAVFGLLYAQCEDDFNRVEQNYIWATGRLAEVEGKDALYSDLRANLFMLKEEAIANYEKSPDWLKTLCNAFADGVNYYLYTHPEVHPRLLTHFEPWMPMYFSEGSIGGDIERISTERIKAFYENKSLALNEYGDGLIHSDPYEEPRGSNGFSISGDLTESGDAMLLINPHTSFYFRGEVHAVSEEGLNAYGAVTWGQFFIYQGFNDKMGWMHTSTYTDVIDEFVENVSKDENDQLTYLYGDESRPVETKEVTLKYKEGDQVKERAFPIYRTHHGPVTHMINDKWVATAMMWEPVKALTQSYTRTKLNTHDQFREMMDIRTNSSNNTVYADADGNIAYYHGNFVPIRDVQFDYTQPIDGSNPATDWQGLHPVDEAITILNPENGWIQNCNSTPFTAAGEFSPKVGDYPNYMSVNQEQFRGVHAIKMLTGRTGYTLDKLIEVAYDPYLPGFVDLIPGLISAYDNSAKDPNLSTAIEELRQWDFKVSKESIAMSLAHFYAMRYDEVGIVPRKMGRMEKFKFFGTESPIEERLEVFTSVVNKLTSDFGQWDTPWGEINRFQRITGDIEQPFDDSATSLPVGLASGRWGALASYGVKSYNDSKRIYGTSGNSFVAVVEFGDKVKAKSMLAGGQSGDPTSPHFYDQAQRYADVQFKDVAYYREDVEKIAKETYKPGERK